MKSVLETIDTFIATVPVSDHRMILVYRRQHGGREFVRWRYWHHHRTRGCWYPDKYRSFVIPIEQAHGLAEALLQAEAGRSSPMPNWLAEVERRRDHRLGVLEVLYAPESLMVQERRKRLRAFGETRPRGKARS